ncbi:hypothetical protein BKA70DRAFT_1353320 [Coprinopsis sp. MPI-PUGE-AT-0042]|nr:hypothetical protein BKA70DRAFT_1353320 [Coprinopsis sp. MPI-PUGE-AT-0042]
MAPQEEDSDPAEKSNARPKAHHNHTIPDSDFDDSDKETVYHEPVNEENHRKKEMGVRFAEEESSRTDAASTMVAEPDVNDDSEVYHLAEASNNVASGARCNASSHCLGPLSVVAYEDRHVLPTTLHIFLWGFMFGTTIAIAIFAAWISGLRCLGCRPPGPDIAKVQAGE